MGLSQDEFVKIILSASLSLTAMLVALFGMLTAVRTSLLNLSGKVLRTYQKMVWCVVAVATGSSLLAVFSALYVLGNQVLFNYVVVLFFMVVGGLTMALWIVAWYSRYRGG
jgi:hypothetical protein